MEKRLADIASAGPAKWHSESSAAEQLTVVMGDVEEALFVWAN